MKTGKRKIEIEKIDDVRKRNVTFCKRRKGLFKKALDICKICVGSEVAAIVFSPSGNPFFFGYPSVEAVLDRFLSDHSSSTSVSLLEKQEQEQRWWEYVNLDEYDSLEDLLKLQSKLEGLKEKALMRIKELSDTRTVDDRHVDGGKRINEQSVQEFELGDLISLTSDWREPSASTTTFCSLEDDDCGWWNWDEEGILWNGLTEQLPPSLLKGCDF